MDVDAVFPRAFYYETSKQDFLSEIQGSVTGNVLFQFLYIEFEVFTAVTMKNAVFWNAAPYRSCVNLRFGGTYRLHLQGRKIRERGTSVIKLLADC
jgi:hypothetical protein